MGVNVYEKDFHVTYMEECSQIYGLILNTEEVWGMILDGFTKKNYFNYISFFMMGGCILSIGNNNNRELKTCSVFKVVTKNQYLVNFTIKPPDLNTDPIGEKIL